MKKIILLCFLFLGWSQTSQSQLDVGLKAGINYNNNGNATFTSAGNDLINGAESRSGFHAGLWFRGKIPVIGLYIRPEIVFTQVKSVYVYEEIVTDYQFKKIDVPVLIGKKFLGFATAFIGPSFQYILEDNFQFSDISSGTFDKFSVGLQTGFGVEFGKLGLDVRWERGLTKTEATFVDDATNITVDNRTNQIIFGLSLEL
jgi:hypothetical protein